MYVSHHRNSLEAIGRKLASISDLRLWPENGGLQARHSSPCGRERSSKPGESISIFPLLTFRPYQSRISARAACDSAEDKPQTHRAVHDAPKLDAFRLLVRWDNVRRLRFA